MHQSALVHFLAALLILALPVPTIAQTSGVAAAPSPDQDDHPLLPPGEGRDLMIRTCSACHAPERAANERRNLADFETLMVEMQGNGLAVSDEDLERIAQYLANAFPPSLPRPAKPVQ
jgi:mono/diheme cytochrome c family protein